MPQDGIIQHRDLGEKRHDRRRLRRIHKVKGQISGIAGTQWSVVVNDGLGGNSVCEGMAPFEGERLTLIGRGLQI